jgi:protein-S-isoprenylcysteine O-methyltransferase Ste14
MTFRIINIAWVALALVWFAGALGNKRTARDESAGSRAMHIIPTCIAFLLLFGPDAEGSGLETLRGAGLAMTLAGLAFAIWARLTIGRNWSGTVELKENHELVRRGPYRIVRHPIYSGLLLAMLGTAMAFGGWRGYLGFAIAFVAWKRKSLTEERFMSEQFGDSWARYKTGVKALIPGLL